MFRGGAFFVPLRVTTFQENYCASRGCAGEEFTSHLFWRCLHRHALPLAPLVAVLQPDFFAADRELIMLAGRARTMQELNEEIRDFMHDTRNNRWWRMRAQVRVSTQRLRRVARHYLADAAVRTR